MNRSVKAPKPVLQPWDVRLASMLTHLILIGLSGCLLDHDVMQRGEDTTRATKELTQIYTTSVCPYQIETQVFKPSNILSTGELRYITRLSLNEACSPEHFASPHTVDLRTVVSPPHQWKVGARYPPSLSLTQTGTELVLSGKNLIFNGCLDELVSREDHVGASGRITRSHYYCDPLAPTTHWNTLRVENIDLQQFKTLTLTLYDEDNNHSYLLLSSQLKDAPNCPQTTNCKEINLDNAKYNRVNSLGYTIRGQLHTGVSLSRTATLRIDFDGPPMEICLASEPMGDICEAQETHVSIDAYINGTHLQLTTDNVPVDTRGCRGDIHAACQLINAIPPEVLPYNLFAEHEYTGVIYVEGPVAVGHDLVGSGFAINHRNIDAIGANVGGTMSLAHGTVYGDIYHSMGAISTSTWQSLGVDIRGHDLGQSELKFGLIGRAFELYASALCRHPLPEVLSLFAGRISGSNPSGPGGVLTLVGHDPNLNVFSLSSAMIEHASQLKFEIHETATNIICIPDPGTLSFHDFQTSGVTDPGKILWVAPQIVDVQIFSFQFLGSLIAPQAHVTFEQGEMWGQLIASSICGQPKGGQLHWGPFQPCHDTCDPDDKAPTLLGVPDDVTVACNTRVEVAHVRATDNCDPNPHLVFEEISPTPPTPGSYDILRQWTARDASANEVRAEQIIHVIGCCNLDVDCNDNNTCNTHQCRSGTCMYEPIADCCHEDSDCHDANACTHDRCSAERCLHEPIADCCQGDMECQDGNVCTHDQCSAGQCISEPIANCCLDDTDCVEDDDACTHIECRHKRCKEVPIVGCCGADSDCNDNNICNGTEICISGHCSAGTPLHCENNDICKTSYCDAHRGCQQATIPHCCLADSDCNDNNICNGTEICISGHCSTGTPLHCENNDICKTSYCDAHRGCQQATIPHCCLADSDCNDNNICNGIEVCRDARCVAGQALHCDEDDTCTVANCDATIGCHYTPRHCDDGNACTHDACDEQHGCKHSTIQDCCNRNADCVGDGDICTTELCSANRCRNIRLLGCCTHDTQCADHNPCTHDSCSSCSYNIVGYGICADDQLKQPPLCFRQTDSIQPMTDEECRDACDQLGPNCTGWQSQSSQSCSLYVKDGALSCPSGYEFKANDGQIGHGPTKVQPGAPQKTCWRKGATFCVNTPTDDC